MYILLDDSSKQKDHKNYKCGQAPVAHTCNPSCLGSRDQEDYGLKPASANSSQDPIKTLYKKGLAE
jgi:hypothetical protein